MGKDMTLTNAACDDLNLATTSIETDPRNFAHWSARLREDDDLARLTFEKNSRTFALCSARLRDDHDFARLAIERFASNFEHCSVRLRDDVGLAKKAIRKYSDTFAHCSDRLKDDLNFATFAVEAEPKNFEHCSDRLKDDLDFATFAVETDPRNFKHCSARLRDDDKLAKLAVKRLPNLLSDCSDRLRDKDEMAIIAITCRDDDSYFVNKYCSKRLQEDVVMQTCAMLKQEELAYIKTKDPFYDLIADITGKKSPSYEFDPDKSIPPHLRGSYDLAMMLHDGNNSHEMREAFVFIARGIAIAKTKQNEPEPLPPTEADLGDLGGMFACHPAHALKLPADDQPD